jgi:hypothetical protein
MIQHPSLETEPMKLKWVLLYVKYRRYLLPAAVVMAVLLGAYLIWLR